MGLDLALGVIILIAAIRGWLQGFITQSVRIAGLIACIYLADPVRDCVKPYILPHLPAIQPDLVERLLWWVSAAITYVVLVGFTTLLIKMTRRPEIPGLSRSGRNDQFAGFLLGAVKGLIIAALLTAGIQKYAMGRIQSVAWAEDQAQTSWALKWNGQYQPVPKIWSSPPVRHFVNHIQRMGLQSTSEASSTQPPEKGGQGPLVQTASRPPALEVADPNHPLVDPPSSSTHSKLESRPNSGIVDSELEEAVQEIKSQLDAAVRPPN
jgi:uncharacterized membrane protein required for colicin V production